MAQYKFVDHWKIEAPIQEVYNHVVDARTYPDWWDAYDTVEVIEVTSDPDMIGGKVNLTVRSPLGYPLKTQATLVKATPPTYAESKSTGQIEGIGQFEFSQEGNTTQMTWTWIIRTNHPLLRILEPIAKPMFRWSHNYLSRQGESGLKKLLENK